MPRLASEKLDDVRRRSARSPNSRNAGHGPPRGEKLIEIRRRDPPPRSLPVGDRRKVHGSQFPRTDPIEDLLRFYTELDCDRRRGQMAAEVGATTHSSPPGWACLHLDTLREPLN